MLKPYLLFTLLLLVGLRNAIGQSGADSIPTNRVYVVSGIGWGFPIGETNEILDAKFSNSLGLNFPLANKHYFLYPSLDFLSFGYNQRVHDPGYVYDLEKGRSNFYILNLAGGIRKQFDKLNIYAFAGPGAGVVVEPRADVLPNQNKVVINNVTHLTPSLRFGAGADYKIGGFLLFIEAGWLHNFRHMQDRPVHVISLYGGLKTDVTRLKDNVARVMGIE